MPSLRNIIPALLLATMMAVRAAAGEPGSILEWAYPMNRPGPQAPPIDDGVPHRMAGSDRSYTVSQIRSLYGVPDWFPAEHPPMPAIVGEGRKPSAFACGYCHLPNGLGRPENAGLAGQPVAYLQQQM